LASDPPNFSVALTGVQAVLHLAGVNRADNDDQLIDNVSIAQRLTDSLDRAGAHPAVVYANSIQAGNGTPFGKSKQDAADHLIDWGRRAGAPVADVRLPNLFGEHGRPHYNSVVATFCYSLARGEAPQIRVDKEIHLLHVQDAVDEMLGLVEERTSGVFEPSGSPVVVSAILARLEGFRDVYETGDIPDISTRLDRALFNTYRSFCFPEHYPIYPVVSSDDRGSLYECVRGHGGQSQVFSSSTHPAITRGNHFHLRKVERFAVLAGSATITLRRLFHDEVVRFEVTGKRPALVDMPTMWTHAITNTGDDELTTLFWADEIFNAAKSDTYPEPVEVATSRA
jgi:UDP-2-acetamido-2,6-beta-L-arabino-hexul-4-ose reductase